MMGSNYILSVKSKDGSELFSIKLISHFTAIYGIDSGEGKSWLFDLLTRMRAANEWSIVCNGSDNTEIEVILASLDTFESLLAQDGRKVIIVDEIFINKSSSILRLINTAKHLLVIITRSFPTAANSPLNGIYTVTAVSHGKFLVKLINESNLLPVTRSLIDADIFVTEAPEGKSEHQLLQFLKSKFDKDVLVIAANGKDNVQSVLLWCSQKYPGKRIIVFTDLYNISAQLKLLAKRCKQNSNIAFFDYGCFEELLCFSKLLKQLPNHFTSRCMDFITLERYYEKLVEFVTKGTVYEYKHQHPILADCYLQECDSCDDSCKFRINDKLKSLLNSDVGLPIYGYFCNEKQKPQLTELNMF